jgi:predicted membrane metal-binding protein
VFQEHLCSLLAHLKSKEAAHFWSSLLVGRGWPNFSGSGEMSRLFMDLGLIHLLVLSGSQIQHFLKTLMFLPALCQKKYRISKSAWFWKGVVFLIFGLIGFYVWDVGLPPPLLRAFLVGVCRELLGSWARQRTLYLALALQGFIFPEHLSDLSFYLSWTAYLCLLLFARIRLSPLFSLCCLNIICQASVVLLKSQPNPSFSNWFFWSVGNMIAIPLFEAVLFPIGASLLFLSFIRMSILSPLGWEVAFGKLFDSLSFLYEIPVQVVLGVLKGIRYI